MSYCKPAEFRTPQSEVKRIAQPEHSFGASFKNRLESSKRQLQSLGDGDFFVGAEDFAHGVADFAECGVRLYGVVDKGHQVLAALRRFAQRPEPAGDLVARAFRAQLSQTLSL